MGILQKIWGKSKSKADTIAFTEGGTEAMRINSDGNVKVSGTILLSDDTPVNNTPIFHAYRNTTLAQVIPTATVTVVQLQAKFYDTDSAYDTGTYRFTVPTGKGGIYFFHFGIAYTSSPPDNSGISVGILKNGSTFFSSVQGTRTGGAGDVTLKGSYTVELTAGDYIQLFTIQSTGVNRNVTGGTQTGHLIPYLAGFRVIQ